jgi:hypothetical protein
LLANLQINPNRTKLLHEIHLIFAINPEQTTHFNINKKKSATLQLSGTFVILAARLRLSENRGSLLTMSSVSRLEHRSNQHTHG